ncbi:MAG: hypothetical protein KGJ93_02845 [Patescibacteria group bacterium]|nr:hypothetical protein [Patescibacteria group bacterium]
MQKKYWVVLAVAAAVVLIGVFWYRLAHKKQPSPSLQSQRPAPSPQQATTTTTSTPPAKAPASKSSGDYTKAVNTYEYRVQFYQCHGSVGTSNVGTLSVAKGSKIMLDNHDPVAHTFAFKGVTVRVAGYNYEIVTPTVIGTYPVTCDGGGALELNVR